MWPRKSTLHLVPPLVVLSAAVRAQDPVQRPDGKPQDASRAEVEELRARIDELERRIAAPPPAGIDLSGREVQSVPRPTESGPLGRPWYENFDLWGFAAVAYLDTGSTGEHPNGGFVLQEASIYAEAQAWARTSVHVELQVVPYGDDDLGIVRTGEIYAHLHDLWRTASGDFAGLKAGRFYVPFGTETEWFRAPQNPLISNSAAFPYGLDEGVLLYGRASGIGWITAVTAGTSDRSSEDGPAKTINLKLSAQPWTDLDVSASFMRNGATRSSALEFGGSNIDPVGSNGFSTAGASPSATVAATLYELDAVVHVRHRTSLGLSFGHAAVDDAVNAFDRSFHWFRVEPRYDFTPSLFGVFRFSEIGTYDSAEGYHFDGEDLAAGNEAFGYDTRRFQRISAGLGWKLNPQSILKLEVGRDRFWVIDGSPADPGAENRDFFGLELVVSF